LLQHHENEFNLGFSVTGDFSNGASETVEPLPLWDHSIGKSFRRIMLKMQSLKVIIHHASQWWNEESHSSGRGGQRGERKQNKMEEIFLQS